MTIFYAALKINATNMYLLMSNVYSMFLSEGSMFQNAIYPVTCFFLYNCNYCIE